MNSKHRKTLYSIFTDPVPKNIEWRKVENLFLAIGCELIEGNGSRVAFRFAEIRIDFHRPHPNKEAKPYQIKAAREFLTVIGYGNEES